MKDSKHSVGGPKTVASNGFFHQLAVPKSFWVNGEQVKFSTDGGGKVQASIPEEAKKVISYAPLIKAQRRAASGGDSEEDLEAGALY